MALIARNWLPDDASAADKIIHYHFLHIRHDDSYFSHPHSCQCFIAATFKATSHQAKPSTKVKARGQDSLSWKKKKKLDAKKKPYLPL